MADLFDRLYPADPEVEAIPVHYFFAALVDYAAAYTTQEQIVAYWGMDSEAEADLAVLCAAIDALPNALAKIAFGEELHAVMMFAEAGAKYDTKETFRARLNLGP